MSDNESSNDPKLIDLREFQEIGFVQESNRLFFHPHGLAMMWSPGWTEEEFNKHLDKNEFDPERLMRHDAWRLVQLLGLDQPHIAGFWDYREDPEGITYVGDKDGFWPDWDEKIQRVRDERQRHDRPRANLFDRIEAVGEDPTVQSRALRPNEMPEDEK